MKAINIISIAASLAVICSCQFDNYDAPDSSLYGTIVDVLTGEPVQSDIYNGTLLNYYEEGYIGLQTAVIKCDGTYNIGQMFAGKYSVIPVKTNFDPVDTIIVDVKGKTKMDIVVKPYMRISNVSILKSGLTKVTATFTVSPGSKWFNVQKVGLFVHPTDAVGSYMCVDSREVPVTDSFTSRTFKIVYDFSESTSVTSGKDYYFRVGALASEVDARYNYAPAECIEL